MRSRQYLRQAGTGPRVPNREHIHVVVRTPNGNDYGKDLLRQHYQQNHQKDKKDAVAEKPKDDAKASTAEKLAPPSISK